MMVDPSFRIVFSLYLETTTNHQLKVITFEYNNTERSFEVHENASIIYLLQNVKSGFNLPDNTTVTLVNPVTNNFIVPLTAADLLSCTNPGIPKYRLIVPDGKGKKNFLFGYKYFLYRS
jgi:hypothetical protein